MSATVITTPSMPLPWLRKGSVARMNQQPFSDLTARLIGA
jgi:hypothetical protein